VVILLKVGSVERGGCQAIFQSHCEDLNLDQICKTKSLQSEESSHYHYLNGHAYLLL